MLLKEIELSGFKSFAKKAQLVFTTPVTAIVGPNGSGKSNVAEAFRFVLGEQSMKSMRGKRTEDLIWNGSDGASKASRARVALTFDNRDHGKGKLFDEMDFEEVTVERVIHRSAGSEYKVNGSEVRLKDIVDMLAHAHVGASGHHIISQGETDRILNVNPKDRKAMIDDALGLRVFQYKKEESVRKLEKTDENIKEVKSQRREVTPHLKFLEKQVEKIQRARQLRTDLVEKYQTYFAQEETYLKEATVRTAREKERTENLLADIENKLAALSTHTEKNEREEALYRDVEALEKKLMDVRAEKEACVRALGRLDGQLAALDEVARDAEDSTVPTSMVRSFLSALGEILSGTEATSALERARVHLATFREQLGNTVEAGSKTAERKEELLATQRQEQEKLTALERSEQTLAQERESVQRSLTDMQKEGREQDRALYEARAERDTLRQKRATIDRDVSDLTKAQEAYEEEKTEARVLVGEDAFARSDTTETVSRDEQETLRKDIERLKIRLEEAGAGSGADVLAEYEDVKERMEHLDKELEDLATSKEKLIGIIADLEDRLAKEFREGVTKINDVFQDFFALMFGGGTAKLKVVREPKRSRSELDVAIYGKDEEAEFEDGLAIDVNLPRKKIRGLDMLSGGERALTSVALLFAMSQVNPPPFLILDETDAALDEANSKRYGDMIERLAEHSQLILITHNRETMSRAGVLYGVTMGRDSASQLLSVDFTEAVKVAK